MFFDTIIICSLTAFVILSTNVKAVNPDYALSNLSQQTQYICLDESISADSGSTMLTDVNANSVLSYSDNTGSFEVNEKLSNQRANAVKSFIGGRGVASSRMTSKGIPMAQYVASNETAEGRAQNRRVEIYITANDEMIRQAEAGTLK